MATASASPVPSSTSSSSAPSAAAAGGGGGNGGSGKIGKIGPQTIELYDALIDVLQQQEQSPSAAAAVTTASTAAPMSATQQQQQQVVRRWVSEYTLRSVPQPLLEYAVKSQQLPPSELYRLVPAHRLRGGKLLAPPSASAASTASGTTPPMHPFRRLVIEYALNELRRQMAASGGGGSGNSSPTPAGASSPGGSGSNGNGAISFRRVHDIVSQEWLNITRSDCKLVVGSATGSPTMGAAYGAESSSQSPPTFMPLNGSPMETDEDGRQQQQQQQQPQPIVSSPDRSSAASSSTTKSAPQQQTTTESPPRHHSHHHHHHRRSGTSTAAATTTTTAVAAATTSSIMTLVWIVTGLLDLAKYAAENGGFTHLLLVVESMLHHGNSKRPRASVPLSARALPLSCTAAASGSGVVANSSSSAVAGGSVSALPDVSTASRVASWMRELILNTPPHRRPQAVQLLPEHDREMRAHICLLCVELGLEVLLPDNGISTPCAAERLNSHIKPADMVAGDRLARQVAASMKSAMVGYVRWRTSVLSTNRHDWLHAYEEVVRRFNSTVSSNIPHVLLSPEAAAAAPPITDHHAVVVMQEEATVIDKGALPMQQQQLHQQQHMHAPAIASSDPLQTPPVVGNLMSDFDPTSSRSALSVSFTAPSSPTGVGAGTSGSTMSFSSLSSPSQPQGAALNVAEAIAQLMKSANAGGDMTTERSGAACKPSTSTGSLHRNTAGGMNMTTVSPHHSPLQMSKMATTTPTSTSATTTSMPAPAPMPYGLPPQQMHRTQSGGSTGRSSFVPPVPLPQPTSIYSNAPPPSFIAPLNLSGMRPGFSAASAASPTTNTAPPSFTSSASRKRTYADSLTTDNAPPDTEVQMIDEYTAKQQSSSSSSPSKQQQQQQQPPEAAAAAHAIMMMKRRRLAAMAAEQQIHQQQQEQQQEGAGMSSD